MASFETPFVPTFQPETAVGAIAPGSHPSVAPDNAVRTSRPYSILPYTSHSVVQTVTLFRQATASQLRRLHYTGTYHGTRVRSRKHLTRLVTLNKLRRIWDVYEGVAEFIYLPPESKARAASMHALDITELGVQVLTSPGGSTYIFDPEPWRWYSVGPTKLQPDAYIDIGKRFFLEMDEGTEYRAALEKKMRQYVQAYHQWPEPRFPKVLFVCHDADRVRFISKAIDDSEEPELFEVSRFGDAVEVLGVSREKPLCISPGLDRGRIQ